MKKCSDSDLILYTAEIQVGGQAGSQFLLKRKRQVTTRKWEET